MQKALAASKAFEECGRGRLAHDWRVRADVLRAAAHEKAMRGIRHDRSASPGDSANEGPS